MKKLPIGIQSFKELRQGGYLYIDKTKYLHALASKGKYYFLSRPRRFGKSLIVSTLQELYSGNKELFQGLWIEDQWDWGKTNPVVHIPFSKLNYQGYGLAKVLENQLDSECSRYGVTLASKHYKDKLVEALQKLSSIEKVVLLIDEYDKPIIDYIGRDLPIAQANQLIFKTFYSVLKDSGDFLELILITGVSKFSQVSIFSDLNHLEDLTIDRRYAAMAGYTQGELEKSFEPYFEAARKQNNLDQKELLEKIRVWYNGYSWHIGTKVYNPFSILNFFSKLAFQNYWFKSGTPSFLIDLLKKQELFDFEKTEVSQSVFDSFEIKENINAVSLLWQTGYLTIDTQDEFGIYTLVYPNKEVRDSFVEYLLGGYSNLGEAGVTPLVVNIRHAFFNNDLGKVKMGLDNLLKSLPYQVFEKTEKFYHAIVHLTFFYLGVFVESEVCTSDGRADAVVQTPTHVYCFEFKLDKSPSAALQQVKEKGYLSKYQPSGKELIGIGVNFSSEKRKMEDWEIERMN